MSGKVLSLGVILALLITLSCSTGGTQAPTQSPSPTATGNAPARTASIGTNVGDIAPDFRISDLAGNKISKERLLAEGKPVLLYFFATW